MANARVVKKIRKPRPAVKREVVRGEPVVTGVLTAARQELAKVGYRALRIEDVALRAGVNKTTVYRRWPTKAELVRDALEDGAQEMCAVPDTGSLRADLLEMGRMFTKLTGSTEGESLMRMMVGEGADPEVADLKKALRKTHEAMPNAMLARAVSRGELAPDVDHTVLLDAFVGAIHHRMFLMTEKVTEAFLVSLVDLLLKGAQHASASARAARPSAVARRTRARAHVG